MLWIGQVAVVTLPAEIDVTNADEVREELLGILNQGSVLLIADLGKTTFCDSAGVSALVRTFRHAATSGIAMRLVVNTRPCSACSRSPGSIACWTPLPVSPRRSRGRAAHRVMRIKPSRTMPP